MGIDVKGKVALVTGANRGIGKAIVESLLKHGAAKVYAAVRDPSSAQALVDEHGARIVVVKCDLLDPASISQAAKEASDVEIVINNAGVLKVASALDASAFEALEYEFKVNVYGLLHVAQAFAPVLKKQGGGAFVQLNSIASLKAFPDFATYCASKAAAYSLTQSLSTSLGAQGTHVLSVHPGPILTDMATDAGLVEIAEPASLVGEGLVRSLKEGVFHFWPDSMARSMGQAYESFAKSVIEVSGGE